MKNHHAVIVGIGQRTEDSLNMTITSKDAKRVAIELEERCDIPKENISLFVDKNATKNNILNGLDDLITKTKHEQAEMIWIYFSGHGYLHPKEIEHSFFLICNDTKNAHIQKTAISGIDFTDKLNQIDSKKILLLLDCCHSGGAINSRINIPIKTESLKNTSNRIVIAASHAEEVAFISNPLSVFTYALIEGLAGKYFKETDKHVTIFDLAMYIRERVFPLSKRQQRPQIHAINDESTHNFILVSYPNGKPLLSAFDEDFTLSDGKGKSIVTDIQVEQDDDYRGTFDWLLLNQNSIVNNGIVVMATHEIKKSHTHFDQANNVYIYYPQSLNGATNEEDKEYLRITDIEEFIDNENGTKKILILSIIIIGFLGLLILVIGVLRNQNNTFWGGISFLMFDMFPLYSLTFGVLPKIRLFKPFLKSFVGIMN
jgi:Caspase domain